MSPACFFSSLSLLTIIVLQIYLISSCVLSSSIIVSIRYYRHIEASCALANLRQTDSSSTPRLTWSRQLYDLQLVVALRSCQSRTRRYFKHPRRAQSERFSSFSTHRRPTCSTRASGQRRLAYGLDCSHSSSVDHWSPPLLQAILKTKVLQSCASGQSPSPKRNILLSPTSAPSLPGLAQLNHAATSAKMSRIHPDRLQMISQESNESPSYEQPPTAVSGQSSRSSASSLPDDSLFGPSAGHDNGWASRRARSTSQATYLPSDSPPRPTTNASASIVRAASDPIPAELAWANRALTSTPSTPAVPSHIVPTDPRVPHSHIAPAPKQLEIPSEERKLEFLLRTIEQRITLDRTISWRWTRHDSELLLKLVSEHKTLHRGYSMRVRAMDTALASFFVFIDCYRAKRVEPEVEEPTIDALREGVQHIILDLCEDAKTHVRKRAYPALLRMSQTDLTVVKHHTSILAQLLHNDGEGELALVQDIFAQHMSLSLSEWLQVAIDDICFGDLRGVVLDFFSSVFGQKALEGIIDNGPQEAQLALHLAPVLPISDRDQYEVIINILHSLQNVWPDTNDPSSMEEKNAARDAGAAVLWNLYLVLMGQSKTFVPGPADVPLLTFKTSELLRLIPLNSAGVFIAGGAALFNDLVKLSLGMGVPECHEVDHGFKKLSEAKIFLNELEVSTRYFFCLLPPGDTVDERNTSNKASAIHHFTPIQRIAFFRSAANLSTKVASAAKESPAELGYPGKSTAIDITKVTTRALMVSRRERL